MKPKHFLYSLLGHLVLLLLMGFTATKLRPETPPPPGAIRVSFGELPRPGRVFEEEAPTPEPEPEPEPLPPVEEEPPPPVVEEEAPVEEAPAPQPEPEPVEPVRPVAKAEAETELPPDLPPLTEEAPPARADSSAVAEGEATPPAPEPSPGQETAKPGTSVQASGAAGAGDAYLGLVQSKIGRRWQPSAAHTAGRPLLETVVAFRIGARGQVLEPTVFAGSGLSVFDREALHAVLEADPLPPPPSRFRASGLNIQFTFTYRR